VHPEKPEHVLCGSVDLHLTTDAGMTWKRVTRWNALRGASNYAHADHHCLLMPATAPGQVYDMNDGGMDVSEDGGLTWTNHSNGLAATMFYDATSPAMCVSMVGVRKTIAPSSPRMLGPISSLRSLAATASGWCT
jgi:hypothetical protein